MRAMKATRCLPLIAPIWVAMAVAWQPMLSIGAQKKMPIATNSSCTSTGTPVKVENGLIAYPDRDQKGRQQIFTVRPDGTHKTQLTFEGSNGWPSWSPDGKYIVYSNQMSDRMPRGRMPERSLWVMDANGSNKRQLVSHGTGPDWGPHNRIVYAWKSEAHRSENVYIIDPDGNHLKRVNIPKLDRVVGLRHLSWSSDGRHLTFVHFHQQAREKDDARHQCPALPVSMRIWVIDADGSNPRQLTNDMTIYNRTTSGQPINSAFDANSTDWSPMSDEIAFWSGQELCYGQIWKMKANGHGRRQLTETPIPSRNDDPAWSPDGKQILFNTDRRGRPELWVMDADGQNERFITTSKPGPFPGDAAWQPIRRCPKTN